jgi:hypothetical protein
MTRWWAYALGAVAIWMVARWLLRCRHPKKHWMRGKRTEAGLMPVPGDVECWWQVCGICGAAVSRMQYAVGNRPQPTGTYDHKVAIAARVRAQAHEKRRRKLEAARAGPKSKRTRKRPQTGPVPLRQIKG